MIIKILTKLQYLTSNVQYRDSKTYVTKATVARSTFFVFVFCFFEVRAVSQR
jgi:hypothetical protein